MGGCGTCKSECGREDGCGTRKAEQTGILDRLIAELYPSRRWGQPDAERCFRNGLGEAEVLRLGQQLADVLKAPVYFVPGGPEDLCSFLYVLCVGRPPALVELRAESEAASGETTGGATGGNASDPPGALTPEAAGIRERYLRLCCSRIVRAVCVQEVAMELELAPAPSGESSDGAAAARAPELGPAMGPALGPALGPAMGPALGPALGMIKELPLPGVFDPKLLKRFQKTVDLLMAQDIEHLDMGLLDVPAAMRELDGAAYVERYGDEPALLNYFFYAQPVRTAALCFVPLSLVARAQAAAEAVGASFAVAI